MTSLSHGSSHVALLVLFIYQNSTILHLFIVINVINEIYSLKTVKERPKQYFIMNLSKNFTLFNHFSKVKAVMFKLRSEFRIIFVMQNKSGNRPLLYNNHTDMHSFVYGNQSQAVSVSVPHQVAPIQTYQPLKTSLFDRYNRCNLYLRDCQERDLIPLSKNIVVHEQGLSGQLAESISKKCEQQKCRTQKLKQQSHQSNQRDSLLKTAPQPVPSRQFVQNEILFNYKEMGDLKRKQKDQYLSTIEMMVRDAQKQISEIEEIQEQQNMEIINIHKHQREIEDQINTQYKLGTIQQNIVIASPEEQQEEVMHIHREMNPREINQILDQHHKLNQDILERASRARSREGKSKEDKLYATKGQKLGQTMKKALGPQKSMGSTVKDGLKGKKGKR